MMYRVVKVNWSIVCILALIIALAGRANCDDQEHVDVMCGPKCLLLICQKFGVRASIDDLAQLSGQDEKGTTMSGLYKAIMGEKLQAIGTKIGFDELQRLQVPAIAHLWGNHFVVIENDSSGMKIIDPSRQTDGEPNNDHILPLDKFKARYSGFALLVSKDKRLFPEISASGSDIRFGEYSVDLGFIDEGNSMERKVYFRNEGSTSLTIGRVRPSCVCLTAEVSDKIIPPGGQGQMNLRIDTSGLAGAHRFQVYVSSNDSVSRIVPIEVGVTVKPSRVLVSTRSLDLGEVILRRGATRQIYVRDPGDGSIRVDKVISDSPLVEARLSERESANKQYPGYEVSVNLKPGTPMGEFKGALTIITNHPKEPMVKIPVTATVLGDVGVSPGSFFMGIVKSGDSISKSVVVSTSSETPLKIERLDSPFQYVDVACQPKAEGKEYTITATLKDSAPKGLIKGDVVVHTNDVAQPEVRVPVSVLVK